MKTLKRFLIVVVCFVLLSSCFIVSAYDEEDFPDWSIVTKDDLLDFGYVEYKKDFFTLDSDISFFEVLWSSPIYPEFNPVEHLPWSTMPQFVQDIVFDSIDDLGSPPVASSRVPFVLVMYNGDTANVWVGYNLVLGVAVDTGAVRIFGVDSEYTGNVNYSICYFATYKHTNYGKYVIQDDWKRREGSTFYSAKRLKYFSTVLQNSQSDIYLAGGNGLDWGTSELNTTLYNGGSDHYVGWLNSSSGFYSGHYIPDGFNYNFYCSYFKPPTIEEQQLETSKGILDILGWWPSEIGEFFESLRNYLLYFQPTEPEHENPFEGILTDVQSFFNKQINDTSDFKTSLNGVFDNVSSYISTGSSVINRLLEGVPLLNAFLIFFVVFAVIRKVVGR